MLETNETGLASAQPPQVSHFSARAETLPKNAQIEEQSEWSLTVHSDYGFSVIIRELMRADLDGDNNEEILVFVLAFAQQGTYRAGILKRAKVNDGGLLAPVPL
jgi:hypothetical protein